MNQCIFCQVVSGVLPGYKVYEDDHYLAFLDIFPKSEGHTLVIPKKHVEWVWDYDQVGEYFEVVAKIARHHRELTDDKIVRSVIMGWDVPHAHIHLLPGKENNLNREKLPGEEMEKIQERFRVREPR